MVNAKTRLTEIQLLRKRLGIKRLRKRILVTEFEIAAVKDMRQKEKHRLISRIKQHA